MMIERLRPLFLWDKDLESSLTLGHPPELLNPKNKVEKTTEKFFNTIKNAYI